MASSLHAPVPPPLAAGDYADKRARSVTYDHATPLTPDDAVVARLAALPAHEAAARLVALPMAQAARALNRLSVSAAGPMLAHLPLDHVVVLLSAVMPERLPALLASLPAQRAALIRTALCSPPGSAARRLSDAFVQATPDTPAGAARARFDATAVVTPLARDLVLVDAAGRLLGSVPRPLLDAAPPEQPVGDLARCALRVEYATGRRGLVALLAGAEGEAVPVVRETGELLGVVWATPGPRRARPWWRSADEWRTRVIAALIMATLVLAGLSTLDPPLHERFLGGAS